MSHHDKKEIKADVEETLPINSSGIVAIFEERWADDIAKALPNASKVTKQKVDKDSADQVKAAASKTVPPATGSFGVISLDACLLVQRPKCAPEPKSAHVRRVAPDLMHGARTEEA